MTREALGPERRRAQLQRAGMELLSERGFWGFTMRDVARRGDVSQATLYNYFGDKQDLVYQVLQRALTAAILSAEAAQTLSHARDRLRALVTDHIGRVMDAPAEAHVLGGAPVPLHAAQRKQIDAMRAEYFELFRQAVDGVARRKGERRTESTRRTQLLLGMLDRAAIDASRGETRSRPPAIAQAVLQIFLHGALGRRRAAKRS